MIYPKIKDDEKRKAINRIKYKTRKIVDNENLKKDIVIIIDNQEKKINHIKSRLEKHGFAFVFEHMKTGDYSFYYQGESYVDRFAMERKNSIEELICSMLSQRFEREIRRAKCIDYYDNGLNTKINDDFYFEIFTERGTLNDVFNGNHKINVDSKRMFEMIQSRKTEYNLSFNFIESPNFSFNWIISTIKYYMYNKIRNELAIENKIFC